MTATLYKSKGERTDYRNYIGISLFRVVGKIHQGILAHRVSRVTEGLIDEELWEEVCRSDLHPKADR